MISVFMTFGFILGCTIGIILFTIVRTMVTMCPSFKIGWMLMNLYACFLFSTLFIKSPFIMISCMFGILLSQLGLTMSDLYPYSPYICVNDDDKSKIG